MERFILIGFIIASIVWAVIGLSDAVFIVFHILVSILAIAVIVNSIIDDFRV